MMYCKGGNEEDSPEEKAAARRENYRPKIPPGMVRLSSMKKMPRAGTACVVKTSDGRTIKGKFMGFTFFPFAGDYACVKVKGKTPDSCYGDQKVFVKAPKKKAKKNVTRKRA